MPWLYQHHPAWPWAWTEAGVGIPRALPPPDSSPPVLAEDQGGGHPTGGAPSGRSGQQVASALPTRPTGSTEPGPKARLSVAPLPPRQELKPCRVPASCLVLLEEGAYSPTPNSWLSGHHPGGGSHLHADQVTGDMPERDPDGNPCKQSPNPPKTTPCALRRLHRV